MQLAIVELDDGLHLAHGRGKKRFVGRGDVIKRAGALACARHLMARDVKALVVQTQSLTRTVEDIEPFESAAEYAAA